jgi:hypothetical protein
MRGVASLAVAVLAAAVAGLQANPTDAATQWYLHSGGADTPAFVQSVPATESAAAASITVPISSGAGDLLVGLISWHYNGVGVSTVTDSAGNHWNGVGTNVTGCTNSRTEYVFATAAKHVTGVTVTFTGATVAAVYVMEFTNVDTAGPEDAAQGTCATSTSPSTTYAVDPVQANELVVGYISGPETIAFSSGPGFTSGPASNSPLIESNAGGTIDDLIAGYRVPAATTGEIYSGTLTSSVEWTSNIVAFKAAGNLDQSANPPPPEYSTNPTDQLYANSWATWETPATYTNAAAGTYAFTYWTNNPKGASNNVSATLTFGYSSSPVCSSVTPIVSWNAVLLNGASGATTSASTSNATALATPSYLCWTITVAAVGKKLLGMLYGNPTYPTSLSTPAVS